MLSVYYQNVRGLNTKISDFYTNVHLENYDIILLTETWLTASTTSSMLFPAHYNVFRCDRQGKRGGGVLIAVNSKLNAKPILYFDQNIEAIWLEIEYENCNKFIIGNSYLPPNLDNLTYINYLEQIINYFENSKHKLVIAGDFNLPELKWNENIDPSTLIGTSIKSTKFLELIGLLNLIQANFCSNSHNNILDLICTNLNSDDPIFVNVIDSPLVQADKFHPAITFNFTYHHKVRNLSENINTNKIYNFKYGNYHELAMDIMNTDWTAINLEFSINSIIQEFNSILTGLMDKYIPKKNSSSKLTRYPHWFSNKLKCFINLKNKWHRKYKKYNNATYYSIFSSLRKHCKIISKIDYANYIKMIQTEVKSNPGKLWNYIQLNNKISVGSSSHDYLLNGTKSSNPNEIVDMFAEYFNSTFSSSNQTYNSCYDESSSYKKFNIKPFHETEVRACLNNIKPTKSSGVDGIPAFLLKELSTIISPIVTQIFNKILEVNVYPDLWKTSYIIPIFKAGKREIIDNYRPIAIQCSIAKIFEKLVSLQMTSYMSNYIIDNQHGFTKGRSIDTNLIVFSEYVTEGLRKQLQTDTIYIDFSKAFDSINHNLLLNKLEFHDFHPKLINLFSSYLKDRKCCVSHLGKKSKIFSPASGVPQGSVLGPLLFNIFINDIADCFKKSNFLLFADDLKIYSHVKVENDVEAIQNDLNNLDMWCKNNSLNINISKTNVVTFSNKHITIIKDYKMNGESILRKESIKDLGVLFSSKFKFKQHITKAVNLANFALGRLKKLCRDFSDIKTIINLYKTLVWSKMEFGSMVWDPWQSTLINECEKINKRFINFINYKFKNLKLYEKKYPERLNY